MIIGVSLVMASTTSILLLFVCAALRNEENRERSRGILRLVVVYAALNFVVAGVACIESAFLRADRYELRVLQMQVAELIDADRGGR